jgi:hypothetical protein
MVNITLIFLASGRLPYELARRWKYATENDVKLPDEYDQIYNDIEPFWGIEPVDLIKIHGENEVHND